MTTPQALTDAELIESIRIGNSRYVLRAADRLASLSAQVEALSDACECAEAVMSIVEPRSDKREYLACLDKLRSALNVRAFSRPKEG